MHRWPVDRASIAAVGLFVAVGLIACGPEALEGSAQNSAPASPRAIVTLAPHLTELVFAAGAGERIAGTVEFSDFPPEARDIPRIGNAFRLDEEAIAALQPDLVIAWQGGNPDQLIKRLRDQRYSVLALEASSLDAVGENLRRIGAVLDMAQTANVAADRFDRELLELREDHGRARPIKVFYQVSWEPLFTISGRHAIGQAIELCGGENIFAELEGLSAAVSLEAVLDALPDAIVASDFGADRPDAAAGLAGWAAWDHLPAVQHDNLFFVDADYMVRPGLRILEGVRQMCDRLDRARERLDSTL